MATWLRLSSLTNFQEYLLLVGIHAWDQAQIYCNTKGDALSLVALSPAIFHQIIYSSF